MESWSETLKRIVKKIEAKRKLEKILKDRAEGKEGEVCTHHFEESDGFWMCTKCWIEDSSRMCTLQYDDEETMSRVHFRSKDRGGEEGPPRLAEDEIIPTNLRELRKLGVRSGIKYSSRMDSVELCGRLGIPPIRGVTVKSAVVLTDQETGEVLRFPSISKAARHLDVNPGSVVYHMKTTGKIKSGGRTFTVRKEASAASGVAE